LNGLSAALARALGELGVGGSDIATLLAEAVEAECVLCRITVSGADLISTGLRGDTDPGSVNEKLTRLRLGYCCRNGCASSYYVVRFAPRPGIEWSEVWDRGQGRLGSPAELAPEQEVPPQALWCNLISAVWVERARKPFVLGFLSVLVLVLFIIGGCRVPGISPKSRVFIVSSAEHLPVTASVPGGHEPAWLKSLLLFGSLALSACSRQNVDPVAESGARTGATNVPLQGSKRVVVQTIDGVALHPGRRRDEIPPVDHPMFGSGATDGAGLSGEDLVVGVFFGGIARAYPLWILGSREIVNDRFGNDAVCVTYCPLSASAVVFLARMGNRWLTFGNEGALYECNLVLYDRQTHSLWYQLRGSAITGDYKNTRLPIIPAVVTRWADWRSRYPGSTILAGDQQGGRFFRTRDSPDPALHDAAGPMAPVSRMDPRLAPTERVLGFCYQGRDFCFPMAVADQLSEGRVAIAGIPGAFAVRRTGGILDVVGPEGSALTTIGAYWFAWHAAFPAGEVITNRSW
jgi:hypothetical protein